MRAYQITLFGVLAWDVVIFKVASGRPKWDQRCG